MLVSRIRDASALNYFGGHPDIASDLGGAVDFTHAVRDTAIFLFGEHGGFCFEWCAPGTYEVHVLITKAGRGPWGFMAARDGLELISRMGAERLWARVDPTDRRLAYFTRKAGFREVEQRTLYSPGPASWRIFEWRKPCPQP